MRIGISIVVVLLAAFLGAAFWYFGSPLFLHRTIKEALPFALPTPTAVVEATSLQFPADHEIGSIMPPTLTVTGELQAGEVRAGETENEEVITATVEAQSVAAIEKSVVATTVIVVEETPANVPIVIGQGQFVDGDSFHKGSGTATLYEGPNGEYLLRLDDFAATNGPDLHVLLSANPTPVDHDSLGDYLDLGSLKGNIGDQNYEIPAGIDVQQYKSVIVYCLPFQVIFATATLQ